MSTDMENSPGLAAWPLWPSQTKTSPSLRPSPPPLSGSNILLVCPAPLPPHATARAALAPGGSAATSSPCPPIAPAPHSSPSPGSASAALSPAPAAPPARPSPPPLHPHQTPPPPAPHSAAPSSTLPLAPLQSHPSRGKSTPPLAPLRPIQYRLKQQFHHHASLGRIRIIRS
jgi:hypothetical protein